MMRQSSCPQQTLRRRRCTIPSIVRCRNTATNFSFVVKVALLLLAAQQQQQQYCVEGWMSHPVTSSRLLKIRSNTNIDRHTFSKMNDVKLEETDLRQSDTVSILTTTNTANVDDSTTTGSYDADSDDDDEYEYVEFDNLTEQEFIGSEWMIGTNWDNNSKKIDETWSRLIVDKDGKNVAIWGDQSQGTWTFDVPSQFLSISKENLLAGKQIWACTISDSYYFLQGTVRGWTYWSAAAVIGQWQAKRLGVDKDEAGTAPWFVEADTEQEATAAITGSEDESDNNDEATDLTI